MSVAGVVSSMCMLLVGFLVGHFELHTTLPTQVVVSFTEMEHKVRRAHPRAAPRSSARLTLRRRDVCLAAHCARRLHWAELGLLRPTAPTVLTSV